jgi:hypothetical protein
MKNSFSLDSNRNWIDFEIAYISYNRIRNWKKVIQTFTKANLSLFWMFEHLDNKLIKLKSVEQPVMT